MTELLKQITLLYVEDDESVRTVFERVLKNKVKNLYIAVDGQDGYEKYCEYKPDIILTDIKMPKQNGIEMSRKIKEINKNVPIIIMSAHSEAGYLLESIELGVDAYLLKPIDRTKLLTMLDANAKVVLFEKEKEKSEHLVNAIVDLQPSIIFSLAEEKTALFVNELFLKIFCKNDNLCAIYEELQKNKRVSLDNDDNTFWVDYIFDNPNKNFKIKLITEESKMEFLVKTKLIKGVHNDEDIVVVTLFEL